MIDATHDVRRRSWIESANGHPQFPIQNLPLVVFSPPGEGPRGGVAIGDEILDLSKLAEAALLSGTAAKAVEAAAGPLLNPLFALGAAARAALRTGLSDLLDASNAVQYESRCRPLLHKAADCQLHLPARIGDFTDFFAGIHHATNAGRLMRPDAPLLPNYKYMPTAYHARSSSVVASGAPIRRPSGQRKRGNETVPTFGPSRTLDYELELGIFVGPGNPLGSPIPIAQAADHIAGFCVLNDWSARDIQGWETQPLGPFLGKSFATTISSYVVTPEALAPFRIPQAPRAEGDPPLLDYLNDAGDQDAGAFDVDLEVLILTAEMRAKGLPPHRLTQSNARHLYWTLAQMVTHHSSGGCNLVPGDLFGSGTISAPTPDGFGSLLEMTNGGRQPVALPSGETRRFIEDGDEVIMRAFCKREGFTTVGFGECRGTIAGGE